MFGSAGFTLVELLVAMALLSLLMLGMASALRSMAQTEERVDSRLEQADEFRVATGFLDTILGRVSVRKTTALLKEGESPYLFSGRPDEMAWLGIMPARHGAGGRTFFRLKLEPVEGEGALVISFLPWDGSSTFPDWSKAQSRVLVHGATSLALSYEDARRPVPEWVPLWSSPDGLPERVRIDLGTQSGAWPMWIVPMRFLPASQGNRSRFSSGPDD
ncbi:MAG: prepilin-type N-terminal cleavage/methylation domain-containing protein [Comamonadaceae bacterium]|jgi:general secretion pathway protein J|nr:prepilin-type N-terminal cleavage/methylation domain-containing protein [Comamonadaceae bacterium]